MDETHPTIERVPHAGRATALVVALVLALVAGTGALRSPYPSSESPGPKAPATPTMVSSWSPLTSDGTIVGGTQAMTIVNTTGGTLSTTIALEPAPCACSLAAHEASTGVVERPDGSAEWSIMDLEPDRSATIEITWAGT